MDLPARPRASVPVEPTPVEPAASDRSSLPPPPRVGALVDYHTHPARVPERLPAAEHAAHFHTSMAAYAARAAALGLAELGFSEHIYRLTIAPDVVPWKDGSTPRGEIAAYVRAALELAEVQERQRARGEAAPAIRLSMEVDVVPSTARLLEAALSRYPFDYILGAVHVVPDLPSGAGPEETYVAYYATLQWAARSGLFHSIAHPDRIHRRLAPVAPAFLEDLMAETARVLAASGTSIELSSSGMRGGFASIDPHETFVRLCYRHAVTVTLGSDAHRLDIVGEGLPAAAGLLHRAGYRQIATYVRGRRVSRPLPAPEADQKTNNRALRETGHSGNRALGK